MIQKIEYINGNGYRYVTTSFQFSNDKSQLESIIAKASMLSGVVSPFDPKGDFRPFSVRLSKNTGGTLAEESFKMYVQSLIKTNGLNAKIIDTNVREEIDEQIGTQIDVLLEVNGKKKSIEVRSSFSYKTSFKRLFGIPLYNGKGAFSIIGWYKHQHKPEEERKNYYIFVIHYYHPTKIGQYCKNEVTAYIAGAASEKTLETKGYDDNLKQRGAMYRVINPLISVADPIDVIDEILEI